MSSAGIWRRISHEGLRILLREEGVSFQRVKTWKASRDPRYATKKARIKRLYAIAAGDVIPEEGEPVVVLCVDEFGPLNLQPHDEDVAGVQASHQFCLIRAADGLDGIAY